MQLELRSSAFQDGDEIPARFTSSGENVSPPLSWSNLPQGTHELILICEDAERLVGQTTTSTETNATSEHDVTFCHWIVTGIRPGISSLPESLARTGFLAYPPGAKQGVNSFGRIGYSGPDARDSHGAHRYLFRLFAVDQELRIPSGATRDDCLRAIEGHLLNEGLLIGVAHPIARAA